jgi:membrane-associated phospholipid phosphatase
MKRLVAFVVLISWVLYSPAQILLSVPDSTSTNKSNKNHCDIKPVEYIIPAAMVTYGFVALKNKGLIRLNEQIKQNIWDNNPHKTTRVDDFTWAVPAVAVYVLNVSGIKGKHNFIDRTILLSMSYAIASAVVIPTKKFTGELRPDSSNSYSFPSGHTSQAFVAAEFLRKEYKDVSPWYGVAGYAFAVTTGYLRMYNNKHWLSDVFAGAGVGILSVHAAYWIYPKLKKKFSKKTTNTSVLMPYYQQKIAGFVFIHQLK